MIWGMMVKNSGKFSATTMQKLGIGLILSSAIYSVSALSYTSSGTRYNPSYAATQSLPALSPQQIAADVDSRFDPLTGRTEYYAPDFDPFENDSRLAGSATLRSASSGISRDGVSLAGGAYIDVTALYEAGSRDPYDAKGLEHAVFMNGEPVNVMSYDVQTLNCTRDTSRVVYDDSYYSGASYGHVGGIYRAYPRYRGHSHYYSYNDRIRYGAWRGLRTNYSGYNGYDHRNDRNRVGNANNVLTITVPPADPVTDVQPDPYEDQRITSRNVIRPDMLGDRMISTAATRNANRFPVKGPISRSSQPVKVPPTPAIRPRSEIIRPDRPTEYRLTNSRQREDIATRPITRAIPMRTGKGPVKSVTRPGKTPRTMSTPSVRTAPASRPVTQSAPAPRATRSTPSRPSRASSSRPSRPTRASTPRSSRPKSSTRPSRSVDRAFGGSNKKSPRARKYYPDRYQTSTYEIMQCVKEERLTLHIPAERLAAAKFDGLSIALLGRDSEDIPLYLPPNYVEGFLIANPYMRSAHTYHSSAQPVPAPVYRSHP